jgi:hypothetical protein
MEANVQVHSKRMRKQRMILKKRRPLILILKLLRMPKR